MSDIPERLLALQAIDTELSQLEARRRKLPEREELTARAQELTEWEQRRVAMSERLDELEQQIADEEENSGQASVHRARLEAQLKTVIAPREAEALMHEIETETARIDELDIAEITALEDQARVDDDLTTHLGTEETLREGHRQAEAALEAVLSEMEEAEASLRERRENARSGLAESAISRYERVRGKLGVAVAALNGRQCQGCHLDLSAAEVDDVKEEAAATGIADCPHCGRMLVV
jgi:predicted  nucleic acid-binding Zn-ribbon protein